MSVKSVVCRGIVGLALLAVVLAACASPATVEPTAVPLGDTAFKITGSVAQEEGWTEEEIKAMETMDIEAENSDGETETYTGVALTALLALAAPKSDATMAVLVADDGYEVELPLADVQACPTCILQFRSNGGFTSRMPGFDKNATVKGIIEIRVR